MDERRIDPLEVLKTTSEMRIPSVWKRTFTCCSLTSFAGFGTLTHMTMECCRNFTHGEKCQREKGVLRGSPCSKTRTQTVVPFMLENVFNQETRVNRKDI